MHLIRAKEFLQFNRNKRRHINAKRESKRPGFVLVSYLRYAGLLTSELNVSHIQLFFFPFGYFYFHWNKLLGYKVGRGASGSMYIWKYLCKFSSSCRWCIEEWVQGKPCVLWVTFSY